MKKVLLCGSILLSALASAQIFVNESFEGTALPTGWGSFSNTGSTTAATASFGTSAGTACAGTKAVTRNLYSSTPSWYLVYTAPAGSSNGTAVNYSFKYLAKGFGTSGNVGANINFEYSVDNGTTWTAALPAAVTISSPNATPVPCTTVSGTIPATAFTGLAATVTPKFRISSVITTGSDFHMGFDDVQISQTITCPPPVTPSLSNPTTSGATVSWTAATSAPGQGYQIYYSTTSTAPTATTTPSVTGVTGTTATLSNLNSSTTYYVWVRSSCSATDNSPWIAAGSITTSCVTASVPYSINFDSTAAGSLPNCTSSVKVATTSGSWTVQATPTTPSGFTGNVLRYSYSTTDPGNVWFFTNGLNLQGGTKYYLSYRYANNSSTYAEKMKVAVGASATDAGMTTTLNDHSNITGATINDVMNVEFTPATTGVYYFGFKAYSDADQYYLYLDDIEVTATPKLGTAEATASGTKMSVYPNPFGDVLNIAVDEDVRSVILVDASGKIVKRAANTKTISTADLQAGMYLIKVELKDGSVKTIKGIKK